MAETNTPLVGVAVWGYRVCVVLDTVKCMHGILDRPVPVQADKSGEEATVWTGDETFDRGGEHLGKKQTLRSAMTKFRSRPVL